MAADEVATAFNLLGADCDMPLSDREALLLKTYTRREKRAAIGDRPGSFFSQKKIKEQQQENHIQVSMGQFPCTHHVRLCDAFPGKFSPRGIGEEKSVSCVFFLGTTLHEVFLSSSSRN